VRNHPGEVSAQLAGTGAVPMGGQVRAGTKRSGGQLIRNKAQQLPSGRIPTQDRLPGPSMDTEDRLPGPSMDEVD